MSSLNYYDNNKEVLIEPREVPKDFRQRFDGSGSRIAKIINDFVQ